MSKLAWKKTPVSVLTPGRYYSRTGYFSNLKIKEWADEYIVTALVHYNNTAVAVEYKVGLVSDNRFQGDGVLRIDYGTDLHCQYAVDLTIKAYDTGLYISGGIPTTAPTTANQCPILRNTNVVHTDPYTLTN